MKTNHTLTDCKTKATTTETIYDLSKLVVLWDIAV